MKKLSVLPVLVAGGFLCATLLSCHKQATAAPQPPSPQSSGSAEVVKIALIIESTIDDKGWCQAMYDGLLQAKKLLPGRIDFSYSEKLLPSDAIPAVQQYATQGYAVIIGHGSQYKNLILEMAEEYPYISFAFGTSTEIGPKNVFTYMPESEETGYLNGLLAGLLTKSGTVGYIGPVDSGDAARYGRGFVLGVRQTNPEAKILVDHTGSFSDFEKAGDTARAHIQAGADILTGASQQAMGGLLALGGEAYQQADVFWLGQEAAQLNTPEGKAKCIATTSYNYAAVILGILQRLDRGIRGGECLPMNFANDGFIFRYNRDFSPMLSRDIRDKVQGTLDEFHKTPHTLDWSAVDYAAL